MKELTIEQKAKAYDEALERAKECHIDGLSLHQPVKDVIEYIFSELKESEDEKIRKYLLKCVKDIWADTIEHYADVTKEQVLAWLEKQGEHANFRNKIQVGDKVTRNEDGVLVNLSQLKRVAKKQGENNMGISEATKQKLEDSLNKALEKETPESCNEFLDKKGEQKPAWSEEDETKLKSACALIRNTSLNGNEDIIDSTITFLKSLKDRVQPKQEWSEEDEWCIEQLTCLIESYALEEDKPKFLLNCLKSLKDKYTWKPSDEQMGVIEAVINNRSFQRRHLDSLYADLKKLREE